DCACGSAGGRDRPRSRRALRIGAPCLMPWRRGQAEALLRRRPPNQPPAQTRRYGACRATANADRPPRDRSTANADRPPRDRSTANASRPPRLDQIFGPDEQRAATLFQKLSIRASISTRIALSKVCRSSTALRHWSSFEATLAWARTSEPTREPQAN